MTDERTGSHVALSVVMPTYNNPQCIELTLRSLTRQTLSVDTFEVVIAKDGDGDGYEVIDEYRKILNICDVTLPTHRGRAAARNAGLAQVRGRTVLFLDSDAYADAELLRRHHAFHAEGRPGAVLLGKTYEIDWPHLSLLIRDEPVPVDLLASPHYDDPRFLPEHGDAGSAECMQTPWLFAFSNNISVSSDTLAAVGGFNEEFGTRWGWEDLELFYRVYQHGGRNAGLFRYDKHAVSYHLPQYRHLSVRYMEFFENASLVKRLYPHLDWEFTGLRLPGTAAAKVRYYRRVIEECLETSACRLAPAWSWVTPRLTDLRARKVLWIGIGADEVPIGDDDLTFDYGSPVSDTNYHLIGTAMPVPDSSLDAVVSVDIWRCLQWVDLCDFVRESTRVAANVLLIHTGVELAGWALGTAVDLAYATRALMPYFDVTVDDDVPGVRGILVRGKTPAEP